VIIECQTLYTAAYRAADHILHSKAMKHMEHTTSKKRILIVEDDAEVLKTFSSLLSRSGYEVMTASAAMPAFFRVIQTRPDLILADLRMPMMNGLEMIGQFKAHEDTRDIPVVVVTGSASEESRAAAFKAGCAGFLTKPIEPVEFLAQIKKFLPGAKPRQP
jgi:CheY-like chemotaxis protein